MTKSADALFEDSFFDRSVGATRTACVGIRPAGEFDQLARGATTLRFTTIKAKERKVSVTRTATGYRLEGLSRVAFGNLASYLMADNDKVDLQFSEDLLNFEPDPSLVNKSKVPLWVIRPTAGGVVSIDRVWSK